MPLTRPTDLATSVCCCTYPFATPGPSKILTTLPLYVRDFVPLMSPERVMRFWSTDWMMLSVLCLRGYRVEGGLAQADRPAPACLNGTSATYHMPALVE